MVFISKEHEVISTTQDLNATVNLYFEWVAGLSEITLETSGSTGTPKIISLTKEAVSASIRTTKNYFNLNSDDFFCCNLNTEYIGGKMMVLRAAEIGCDLLILRPSANPFEELGRTASLFAGNWGKNFFSFAPLQLQNILQKEEHIQLLRTAKAVLVGGAPVSDDIRRIIQEKQLPVYETYGMTETISHIAVKDLRTESNAFNALPEVQLEVDSDNCLHISAPSTLNRWITTNDIVELVTPNSFIYKGRKDNIINSGGIKIQLEEVEKAISKKYPTLDNYFCYGLPDKTLGTKLVLFIDKNSPEITLEHLSLPKYHLPKEIYRVDAIEKTPSGKTDKIKTIEKTIK